MTNENGVPITSPLDVSYFGYFTPLGGYGIANLYWITYLSRLGVNVFPHKKFSFEPGSLEYKLLTTEQIELLSKPFEKQRIGIIETTPFDFDIINTEIKIANTMCESSLMSKEWVDPINRMDYVIVPNEFQKKVFIESGVKRPITIIPHGQDHLKFAYKKRQKKDIFTFGMVGYLNDRKGVFDVISAFVSEFAKDEPVRLYLKSSNKFFAYYTNLSDERVTVDVRHLSLNQIRDLYYSFDCFVFPSKAEGVGNPPREALLTGCPIIIGNYSGLEEIAKPGISYAIDPISFTQRVDMLEQPGDWANYDIQELMFQMRYVYEHQDEANEKARLGSQFIAKNYNWDKVTHQLIDFLKTL